MKAGWERTHDFIMPDIDTVRKILTPFLKGKRVTDMEPLSGGLNNSNIKITTDTKECFVLRIYSKRNDSPGKETAILNLLSEKVPVPSVLYSDRSCFVFSKPFMVLSWIPGLPFSEMLTKKDIACTTTLAAAIGETLANIHHITFSDSGFLDEDLNIKEKIKLDAEMFVIFIKESMEKGFGEKHIGTGMSAEVLRFSLLENIGVQNKLVHSDFNPLNIFVNGSTLSAVLDWEYALSSSPLLDIGNMVRYESLDSTLLEPFVEGYLHNGGHLPEQWLQKAKLLDFMALFDLLNKEHCGERRRQDITRIIRRTIEDWEQYDRIQQSFTE
ncbi:phosphotransferase family protein [Thalassobacillus pellis]|uniref:phosphotransferase family protein n=1 Tax=Thalassobacillus pellis TaxID=748008 RepID=UPI00195F4EBA|nr:aminoglycoside phosphotransferase family protein [Thalassobacillus pellis]MBM7553044.1 fructokinase [Thalassobacillus pellis]